MKAQSGTQTGIVQIVSNHPGDWYDWYGSDGVLYVPHALVQTNLAVILLLRKELVAKLPVSETSIMGGELPWDGSWKQNNVKLFVFA